ncbi:glycoside hydrolase family 31 protein [Anaeromicropila herbilytica]|uniref:Alpha-xylosidase n=1 Tax=Anaeromicropila herbilytica TaxID=2785025 RepID=A0A7R7ID80_9FIRM|nr:TIM-barrel domain-containing protein [Anaeromicropila herbilytica]BCN31488.1 alpha-xylosidase [Anaeromicropila herbilytica]
MKAIYQIKTAAKSNTSSIIKGVNYRFTVLTDYLVRMEYNSEDHFVDLPSQTVWCRDFPELEYELIEDGEYIVIQTKGFKLEYKKGYMFSKGTLKIQTISEHGTPLEIWHYGDPYQTLKGTLRTLDEVDGSKELGEGMISRQGYTLLDDSKSYLINDEGIIQARPQNHFDCYFFGYGHSYKECIRDFYHLTGMPPLLPRYALGNWWSRFHRYTQEEYRKLITTFEENNIPLSVAVIDMDWHITQVEEKYLSGWTGYTWNKELFPEPEKLLKWLHAKNLKITLNVHPAQGVRPYEAKYKEIAEYLGYDILKNETIDFDAADSKFMEAYFEFLHHPLEEQGVDFWWVDWQQGEDTKLSGLDPLWILNHYHYLDNSTNGKRPLILSRYADLGSHRYPVGFSGDSIISWASLDFQPYFTATASNVGYCWWSHDIGGHMLGKYQEELQVRWVQFGVFSPIMRLHSSASVFNHKEPWNYSYEAEAIISRYMRLRHKMIPYIYSMNYRTHANGIPLIVPMYYEYPEDVSAYHCPNEYFFGSELIVLPITSKVNQESKMANVNFWFPESIYIDYFTGLIYQGKRRMHIYRNKENIPVFMKAGAIIPLVVNNENLNDTSNPECIEICVAAGADGEFSLYEDDGISMDYEQGHFAMTKMILDYQKEAEFIIQKPIGDMNVIPKDRRYQLRMKGFKRPSKILMLNKESLIDLEYQWDSLHNEIFIKDIPATNQEIRIKFVDGMSLANNNVKELCFEILDHAEIDFFLKEMIMSWLQNDSIESVLSSINTLEIPCDLYGAISEVLLAQDH